MSVLDITARLAYSSAMHFWGWSALLSVLVVGCAPSARGGSVDYATRVRGCATSLACVQREPMGECVQTSDVEALAHLRCFAAANGDCDAALRCLDATAVPDPSCTRATQACEGTTVVFCTPAGGSVPMAYRLRADCAADGEICFLEGGFGGCVIADCTDRGVRCVDGDLVECDGLFESRTRCGEGTACDAALGRCVADGPACSTDRCDGSVVIDCDRDVGREVRRDCADYDQICGTNDFGTGCIAMGTECDPETFSERCVGSALEFCSPNGNIDRFDCDANGFDGCAGPPVHCVPRGFSVAGS